MSRFFSNVVYFFHGQVMSPNVRPYLVKMNPTVPICMYLESKGSRLSISQTLGNLELLIFLFTQNKFTFITS